MGKTNVTFRPRKRSRAVRTTLLLLLVALALTPTVSFAQDGKQGSDTGVDMAVEPPPQAEPEPPPITLPPAEPGEELQIAEVTIESAEQLAALQQLGFSCGEAAVCEIVATEAQLSALREAGFELDIFGLVGESHVSGRVGPSPENGLEESSCYGINSTNYTIPDYGSATSTINISGAPAGARVTRVKYGCRVAATGPLGGPGQYTLDIQAASLGSSFRIWNREGGDTDEGRDDDISDDRDIHLGERWVDAFFDGQPVNQAWRLRAEDHTLTYFAWGEIDWWELWVYYCTTAPGAPTLSAPADGSRTLDTTPTFDWADAAGATSYHIQVDDSATFMSPVINTTTTSANYTPSTPLPLGHYYWRVRSQNACGNSDYSPRRDFYIDAAMLNRPPVNGSIHPSRGGAPAGNMVYFTSSWSDPNGSVDLKACRLHVGRWAAPKSLIGNAVMVYQARTNKILLRNDRGTRWWGGKLVGSANVVQNSQFKAYCNLTTVARTGTTITVRWAVEFKPAFRGRTKMYLKARDVGGLTSPLEKKGTWTVQ
jgi:hypothetical protein